MRPSNVHGDPRAARRPGGLEPEARGHAERPRSASCRQLATSRRDPTDRHRCTTRSSPSGTGAYRCGVMAFPTHRPRRLRATPALRRLVAETTLRPRQLVLPMFVKEGATEPRRSRRCPVSCSTPATRCARPPPRRWRPGSAGSCSSASPRGATPPAPAASTRTACSTSRCATCGPRSATRPWSWPTRASTSSPTTATAACSTTTAGSTTTPRSPSTRRWPWRRPTPGRTCSARAG